MAPEAMEEQGQRAGGVTFPKVVACIGVFDGMHRGHQLIFYQVLNRAAELGGSAVVVTFDPYPVEVFRPEVGRQRLQNPAQKRRFLLESGFHGILELRFSREMAATGPVAFVEEVLLAHLELAELYVGYDFRFGQGRSGGIEELEALGERWGFRTVRVPALVDLGLPVSSSRIRKALEAGDLPLATRLLGRPHAVAGRVVPGQGLGGRHLVPTANLAVDPRVLRPRRGVYVAEADLEGELHPAVLNWGRRPTVGGSEETLEVHFLSEVPDLLGRELEIHLLEYLRPEREFGDLEELRKAIEQDIRRAKAWFQRAEAGWVAPLSGV
jgi:riboflavin kinase/FMN adenylyltransferase